MYKDIKLFTVDLDGTLFDEKENNQVRVSQKNVLAIQNAKKRGIDVVISTGRVGDSARNIAKTIPANYIISGNGSEIFDKNGKSVFQAKINIRQGLKLLEIIKKYRLCVKPDNFYVAYGASTFFRRFIAKKMGWKTESWYTYPLLENRYKFLLFGTLRKSLLKKAIKEINEIDGLLALASLHGYTIEVTSDKASKGLAAKFVGDLLNLNKSQIAHIGDTMNDSTAIDHIDYLICMKNGSRSLKKLATHIGPKHKNGGVAKILNSESKLINKKAKI